MIDPINKRIHHIWYGMLVRCRDPRFPGFKNYGGRGIIVCEEWQKSYASFKQWALTNGYAAHLTLDRIDTNLGYFPANCRWATPREQMQNRRDNVPVTAFGETKTISDWLLDERCVANSYHMVWQRLDYGMSMEDALTQPVRKPSDVTAFGETKRMFEWAKDPRCVVSRSTLSARIHLLGMTPEDAIATPLRKARRTH